MGNDTKQNITQKKKIKKRQRRLKIGRFLVFLFLLTAVSAAVGWCGYHLYQWGSSLHDEYRLHETMRKQDQDPRFDNYTNILILGIDDGIPGNEAAGRWADTLILTSFRQETGEIRFLSIPRDTMVTIPGRKNPEKINAAYYYGGAPLAVQTTAQLLNISIQEYVAIDIDALVSLVDALGGIDLYVETNMDYEDPSAELSIHLQKGYQHLNGDAVQKYLRYRSDDLGDIGRVKRQQRFIKAVYEKISQAETITKLPALSDVLKNKVSTSIDPLDMLQMASILRSLQAEQPQAIMLPGRPAPKDAYWVPDQAGIDREMQAMFPEIAQETTSE